MKQIEVVAAIIRDSAGRIFATQRGYGEWKDWWEFPGGKMEAGETSDYLRETAKRNIEGEISADEASRLITSYYQSKTKREPEIHAFGEGITRTTAVFTIQYLRSIGFDITNDLFAKHSWYFRNALVRSNYKNARLGIDYTSIYLERFFRNLLLGEQWDLRNRYLHIQATDELLKN